MKGSRPSVCMNALIFWITKWILIKHFSGRLKTFKEFFYVTKRRVEYELRNCGQFCFEPVIFYKEVEFREVLTLSLK